MNDKDFEKKVADLLKKNDQNFWENNHILHSLTRFLGFRLKLRIIWFQIVQFIKFLFGG